MIQHGKSRLEVFLKKVVLKDFAQFTEKQLRPATLFKTRLWQRYFPINCANLEELEELYYRTPPMAASINIVCYVMLKSFKTKNHW